MKKEIAEAVALLRHEIISPVLMDTQHSQMKYFRSLEGKNFDVPGKGKKCFKATTMKMWLHRYRQHGIQGITPGVRADLGGYRKVKPQTQQSILELRKENPELSVARFFELCLKKELLGHPPLCLATVRRFLRNNELARPRTIEVRKRFEMSTFGEMWTGDFMHGPKVQIGKKVRTAILFAIIDDHSRYIVGSCFGLNENTMSVEGVLKDAILAHGIPDKIYLDNGPSFSSHYLKKVCAHLKMALIHSRPYDSPSRGKIERFFRNVREGFLNQINEGLTLEELNEKFKVWLRDDYHHRFHQGISGRPIDRYTISMSRYPRKRIDPDILNEYFMVQIERMVKKDATISYLGKLYEVPARYIGQSVEIRHLQDDPSEIYIYENDKRSCHIKVLDAVENGRIFRPQTIEQISFTNSEEEKC